MDITSTLILILLVSVFVLPELSRKTKKFKEESHFVNRKHCEGTFEGVRTPLRVV